MVRIKTDCESIINLFERNKDDSSDGIQISSHFQRGDEETGVWDAKRKENYIDSLKKHYPTGILTFVKDKTRGEPWLVLDGGNRLHCN